MNSVASIVTGLEIVTRLERRSSTVSHTFTNVLLMGTVWEVYVFKVCVRTVLAVPV